MPRFFSNDRPIDGVISLYGDDARHIGRSLRMRLGDSITVCHEMVDYNCKLVKINDEVILCEVTDSKPSDEPNISLTLYMALPKGDKLDLVVQKAVELGADKIIPVVTSRCIANPKENFSKRRERLQRIALEAAKQSGRGIIPQVESIISFDECLKQMSNEDLALVLYENGGKSLKEFEYPIGGSVGVLVGSEGGFAAEEIERCKEHGIKPIWLGNRILRCETAPITAISIIMHHTGNI